MYIGGVWASLFSYIIFVIIITVFKQLAVVITDGKQTKTEKYTPLSEASQGIKNKSVTVYAVGVGKSVEEEELLQIASASEYVRTTSSFEDLQKIASGIRRQFCESSNDQGIIH